MYLCISIVSVYIYVCMRYTYSTHIYLYMHDGGLVFIREGCVHIMSSRVIQVHLYVYCDIYLCISIVSVYISICI